MHFDDGDLRSFRSEQLCHGFADVSSRAGDDGDLSFEFHCLISFLKFAALESIDRRSRVSSRSEQRLIA